MRTLDRKLWRDLWGMKGQALAIALVIASGVATFVMSISTLDSLRTTRAGFYRDYRFASVFASLKRAPESAGGRIADIPGVARAETRVTEKVNIDIPGYPNPVTGKIVSVPDWGEPRLNRLFIREGRAAEPGRDEVEVIEPFAKAHGLKPGDTIRVTINGKRRAFVIAGIALSPEYIYPIAPGAVFPDFERYAILWMARTPLAAASNMEGAFNDVAISLSRGASVKDVIERTDAVLAPYGGLGAYGRKDQLSDRYLSDEFRQLGEIATIFPVIFLGVAAFLLNVVAGRLIATQREVIAVLKAFGYTDAAIGAHYLKFVLLIVLFGVIAGLALGAWFGQGLSALYAEYYKFPILRYGLRPGVAAAAAAISAAAAVSGTVFAVRAAVLLAPAEAMRPEPPVRHRVSVVERLGLGRLIRQPGKMIVRNIERRPIKAALTSLGIAMSVGILIVGRFSHDAINYMVDVQFNKIERADLSVSFYEPASKGALYTIKSLPGVIDAEPFRAVPVRLKFGNRSYRTLIQGFSPNGRLVRLLDSKLRPIHIPAEGMVLSDNLGHILGVSPGDTITAEVLEGGRPVRRVPVQTLASQFIGVGAYMDIRALNRLMREDGAVSGVNMTIDPLYRGAVYERLKEMPKVAGVTAMRDAVRNFLATAARTVLFFTFISTLLAATIAFGVVYNSARITLAERARELASLRILGFTRGEISYILLGELAVLTLAAIPAGFLIGRGLCAYMSTRLQTDLYRVPLVIDTRTYAFAAAAVLASTAVSGLIVRHRLDHLDLVAALKTKE